MKTPHLKFAPWHIVRVPISHSLASWVFVAAAAGLLYLPPAVFAQTPPPVSFRIGTPQPFVNNASLFQTVVGDFNGDGKLDFASVNGVSLFVSLGNGDGTFQPFMGYDPVFGGAAYDGMATGDMNGDGKLDLVAVSNYASVLEVWLGNGDGTFQPGLGDPNGDGVNATFVALGDFNRDGKLDVATSSGFGGHNLLSIALGDGTGGARAPTIYPTTGAPPNNLAVGDFNGDGILDLAVSNCGLNNLNCLGTTEGVSAITIFLGNGDGTFRTGATYIWGASAYAITAGDFNGDGKLDLAVADGATTGVGVFIGNGDGTFQAPVTYDGGISHDNIVVADFNGDGKADLAVSIFGENAVGILLGNGDGTFQPVVKYALCTSCGVFPNTSAAYWIAVGDFNGDGRPDILSFDNANSVVHVLLNTTTYVNTASGTNIAAQPLDITTGTNPVSLNFSSVTQPGMTTLTTRNIGPASPSGFQLGSPALYYDVATTATFSGSVTICINYTGTPLASQSNLQLLHYSGGAWVNVTTSVDTMNHVICGNSTSFSPFVIAQALYSAQIQQPINADGSSIFSSNKGVVPVKFSLTLGGTGTCSLPIASIVITATSGGSPGVIDESVYEMPSDTGTYFRVSDCQYVYNLSSKSLGVGNYRVDVVIGTTAVGSGFFGLK